MPINLIKDKILKGEYRFSEHAVKRMIKRLIERFEVEDAIINGEIITAYEPDPSEWINCRIRR